MISNALKENTTLTSLNLSGNKITNQSAMELKESLKVNTTLKELILDASDDATLTCKMTESGIIGLCEGLMANRSLTKLSLCHHIFTEKAAKKLGEVLSSDIPLTYLDVSYCGFGSPGAIAICEALKSNTKLETLKMNNDSIAKKAKERLGDMLSCNKSLTCLCLSRNPLSDGVDFIFNGLKANTSLIRLELAGCNISDSSMEVMSEMLKVNKTLQSLCLWDNDVKDVGAEKIDLEGNTSLTELNLSTNKINKDGAVKLYELQQAHPTLINLRLAYNPFGDEEDLKRELANKHEDAM